MVVTSLTASNGTTSAGSTVNTASVSPPANALLVLWTAYAVSGGTTVTGVTGLGLTWSQATTKTASSSTKLDCWTAQCGGSAPTPGAITITVGTTAVNVCWDVDQVTGEDTSTPLVTSNTKSASGSASPNAAVTMNAAGNANNLFMCGIGAALAQSTSPHWNELADVLRATPSVCLETQVSNDASDTAASGTIGASGNWAMIGIEIKAAAILTVTAVAGAATSAAPTPTVASDQNVTLSATSALATSAAPSPVVTVPTNVSIGAVAGLATSTAPAPMISLPTSLHITAVAASAISGVPTPGVNLHDEPLSEVYFGETYFGGEGLFPPASPSVPGIQSGRVQVIRELPPTHLSIEIETPSGHFARWGRDEIDGGNVPSGLRFSSTIPGGYESLDCTLPRNPKFSYNDLEPLSTIKVFGSGEQCGEYRLEGIPVTSGDQMAVTPSATGFQSYLNDNESQNAVIIDRQLSRWSDTFTERKENLHNGGYAPDGGSFSVEAGNPGRLSLTISDVDIGASPTIARPYPIAEAMYDGGAGVTIAQMLSDYGTLGSQGAGHDLESPWTVTLWYGYRDSGSSEYITWGGNSTVTLPGPGSITYNKPSGNGWRYILAQLYPTGTLTESGVDHKALFSDLRLIGNHGLTLYDDYDIDGNPIYSGSNPAKAGFLGSDIVKWIISTYFPSGPIRYDELTIQPSKFIIPNLVFSDMSPGAMINNTLRFGEPIPDWAIYNNGTMMLRERDPSRGQIWRARIGPAKLSESGPDISRLYSAVKVAYQDVDGSTRTVGPTGSCADIIDNSLKDTDPENPLNQRGAVKLKNLSVSTYVTQDKAVQIGKAFMEENKIISRAGQASLNGYVEHASLGVLFPYWSVKAGDYIEFIDASDPSPRHISRVDHDNDTRTATLAVDAPPDTLTGYMERLAVVLTPLGLN